MVRFLTHSPLVHGTAVFATIIFFEFTATMSKYLIFALLFWIGKTLLDFHKKSIATNKPGTEPAMPAVKPTPAHMKMASMEVKKSRSILFFESKSVAILSI